MLRWNGNQDNDFDKRVLSVLFINRIPVFFFLLSDLLLIKINLQSNSLFAKFSCCLSKQLIVCQNNLLFVKTTHFSQNNFLFAKFVCCLSKLFTVFQNYGLPKLLTVCQNNLLFKITCCLYGNLLFPW